MPQNEAPKRGAKKEAHSTNFFAIDESNRHGIMCFLFILAVISITDTL